MVVSTSSIFRNGAIEKNGRLRALLPCICIGHFGRRDIYWIDGQVIHRQNCPRAQFPGMTYTFCKSEREGNYEVPMFRDQDITRVVRSLEPSISFR